MWTETTREQYRREDLRYASDMTDAEWALIEPHMPTRKVLGRPRIVPLRGVVDALLYILRTACPWRLLPRDFQTARQYSATSTLGRRRDRLLASIRHLFPWLRHVFADGGYAGEKLETALAGLGQWTVDHRDRQAVGPSQGVSGAAKTLGGRANFRLVWS